MNIRDLPNRDFAKSLAETDNGVIQRSESGGFDWFTLASNAGARLLMAGWASDFGKWETVAIIAPSGGFWAVNPVLLAELSGTEVMGVPRTRDLWKAFSSDVDARLEELISRKTISKWAAECDGCGRDQGRGKVVELYVKGVSSSGVLEMPLASYDESLEDGALLSKLAECVGDWSGSVDLTASEYLHAHLDQIRARSARLIWLADELKKLESGDTPGLDDARGLYSALAPLLEQGGRYVKIEIAGSGKMARGSVELGRLIRAAVRGDTVEGWDLRSVEDRMVADAAFGPRWAAAIGRGDASSPSVVSASYRGHKIWECPHLHGVAA